MRRFRLVLLAASLSIFAGCVFTKEAPKPQTVTPINTVETVNYSWQAFPEVSEPSSAKILIEQKTPKTVKVSEIFECTIDISNRSDFTIAEAMLKQQIPANFTLVNSNPKAVIDGNHLTWILKNLAPGTVTPIVVTGKVSTPGTLKYIENTELSFASNAPEHVTDAVRADLTFALTNPKVVVVSEEFPVDMTFRNPGTGVLTNVKIIKQLPDGLLTSEGKSRLSMSVGDIAPGQSRDITVNMKTDKPGLYSTTFNATADDGISTNAKMELKSTKPSIVLAASAPSKRFVGRIIPYKVSVRNNGDAVTKNIVVKLELPDGVELAAVNENGFSSKAGQLATWTIPSLLPDATINLTASAMPKRIMVVNTLVSAETLGQNIQKTTLITDVAGIPGLLGSVIDDPDPVSLGSETIYTITMTNQGSLPATKIKVKCTLEDSMQFVKAEGATKGALYDGDSVIFEPLSVLEPQSEAKWYVTVKAIKTGDVRFSVDVTSDQLERPVHIEQSTNFYE
ncbi:MAG TPA: hypothetical protein DD381_01675 [Lentisphaeria bacterium]|nr:MAG: hypothetical protein A2X47_10355 [Lentisphaerae bacterium GWF2_38_69]HBM15051.1 hypothetical protein [Lentisphaeria bacterium]